MKTLLTKKEAAQRLRISVRTLDYFRQSKNLPYHLVGNQVRFVEDELERWAIGSDASAGQLTALSAGAGERR